MFRCDLPFAVDLCSMCEASMLRDAAPVDAEECCTWDAWAEACMAERFTTREVV